MSLTPGRDRNTHRNKGGGWPLNRYRDNPQYMTLDLDAKDRQYWTGDVVDVEHRAVVDDTGLPVRMRWQIVSAEEKEPGHSVSYKLFAYEFKISGRPGYWMPIDAPDYVDATDAEKASGAWWADENGMIGDEKGFRGFDGAMNGNVDRY